MKAYDGDASISDHGKKFLVRVEANNFRGDVYITRARAAEIRDQLNHDLRHWPRSEPETTE